MKATGWLWLVVVTWAMQSSAQLAFIPLGDLPGGAVSSAAYGVSADGITVVGSSLNATGSTAFSWTEAGGLRALPMLSGGAGAVAHAASANGGVVVGAAHSPSGWQAVSWSAGSVSGLGDLANGAFESAAYDVSDDGAVIVGYGTSASGREAFRWTGGSMTGLGDLAGGAFQSEAHAVTPDGAKVTGYGTATGQSAFMWDAVNGLQTYAGSAWAYDLSADGQQVVGHINATFVNQAVSFGYRRATRWNGGTADVIGPSSSGDMVDTVFHGVTADGALAVGSFRAGSSTYRAVSHDAFNSVRDIRAVLVDAGIDMTGWSLHAATAVSADGSVVVGYGTNPDGQREAWVVKGYGLNLQLRWVGNNSHWPPNGELDAGEDLWMNIDSKDLGVGVTGVVVFSTDKGLNWQVQPLVRGTPGADYDHWYRNIGSFPAGTTIRYSLAVEDAQGFQRWDNNQGRDFYAVVSPGSTEPVQWIGNDVNNGTVAHAVTNVPLAVAPTLSLTGVQQQVKHLLAANLQPQYPYELQQAEHMGTWQSVAAMVPDGTNTPLAVTNGADTGFYRLRAAATSAYFVVTREVWPQDSGKAARIGYRLNGGEWTSRDMSYAGQVGNNDVWRRTIGPVTPGTTIEYFIEVISASGGGLPHYDNNDNNNYSFTAP